MRFKLGEVVRIKGEKKGSMNEKAVVRALRTNPATGEKGYWISNMNMPFQGTLSGFVTKKEIERL